MIQSYQVQLVVLPLARPMATAIHRTTHVYCALLRVQTADAEGQSFVFSLNRDRAQALKYMIDSLASIYVNTDETPETLFKRALVDINASGAQGFAVSGITAWDTALWDALGKAQNRSLAELFGQVRSEVPAYASSGLWLSYSIDELLEEADRFIQQGFRSVKLRVDGQVERDADRAHALRDALGDDIEILVDANQALDVDTAIALARALERYNIGWFEEPVLHSDLDAQRIVREASPIPIAGGETDYTCVGMRRILDANCTDVLMPDLQRIGGLTEMRNAAKLAASYNAPISTHIFTEYSLSIAASSKNCISVEHVDWYEGLFTAPVQIKNGQAQIPTGAGTGFVFDDARIAEYGF